MIKMSTEATATKLLKKKKSWLTFSSYQRHLWLLRQTFQLHYLNSSTPRTLLLSQTHHHVGILWQNLRWVPAGINKNLAKAFHNRTPSDLSCCSTASLLWSSRQPTNPSSRNKHSLPPPSYCDLLSKKKTLTVSDFLCSTHYVQLLIKLLLFFDWVSWTVYCLCCILFSRSLSPPPLWAYLEDAWQIKC